MQFPWKLIYRSLEFALLTSALLDHQLDILVVEDTDEVTLGIAVVQGDVVHLEDVPEERQGQEENDFRLRAFSDVLNPIIITAVRLRFRRISKMSDMPQKRNKQRLKLPCVTFQLQGSIRCCTKLSFITSMELFCNFFIFLLCLNTTTLITRPC